MGQSEDSSSVGSRIRKLRGAMAQTEFAERLGVDRKSVAGWEADKRLPDGSSLLNVNHLLTGSPPQEALSRDERDLLALFRAAPLAVKGAAIRVLDTHSVGTTGQVFNAPITGGVAGRNIINKGKK
jgi:transcriptional regulator with XRE-family HTH domain